MKSNKSYITSSIAVQMIVIPVLLTIGLIAVSGVTGKLLYSPDLGKSAVRFIYLLIAFFGALIVGGVVGSIFALLSKNSVQSSKARYIPAMIPIIYALVFALPALIFSNDNYNSSLWGIYFLKNPTFFIFGFVISFAGLHFLMPVTELAGYIGFGLGILIYDLISKTAIKDKTGKNIKVVFSALCAAVIIFICFNSSEVINYGVIELQYGKSTIGNDLEEFDLIKIAPFKEKNGLAKLDKKASLQFTELDEMPRLDGATAAYPVYAAFVEAVYKGLGDYYNANKDAKEKDVFTAFVASQDYPFDIVKCSKTADAYENLINGKTDIIFVAEPSKKQVEMIKAKGEEFVLTPIGSEAFVFFTNIKNTVENLSIKQIQDIYSGKITNWKEVNGPNKSILPFQRPENSGSQTIMQNKVMDGIKMLAPTKETKAGGMGEIISQVASYKNARNSIGYSFMYYSSSMIKNNQIKYISVDGVKPNRETVRSRQYPFTVPVYAVSLKSNTNKNINKFIDWILSEEGQSLIEKTGYVSVK